MTSIAPHMEAFLREHLVRHRGASQHTCDSYAYSFQALFEFAARKLRTAPAAMMLEQLDATLISAFLEHLETSRGNSAETRNIRLAAIRSFFRFLQHASQRRSSRFAVFWRFLSKRPTLVWYLILSRKRCRLCSTLLIQQRGQASEIAPCCTWRCAPASESQNSQACVSTMSHRSRRASILLGRAAANARCRFGRQRLLHFAPGWPFADQSRRLNCL
jgi:Phage integrase, N-terminal SAM-like domain